MRTVLWGLVLVVLPSCGRHSLPLPPDGATCSLNASGSFAGTTPLLAGIEGVADLGGRAVCQPGISLSALGIATAVDQDGVLVPSSLEARNGNVVLVFTPPHVGLFKVRVIWPQSNGFETVGDVEAVEERPHTFISTTFVDRMENCASGPFRTSSGLTLCERIFDGASLVSAYKSDGSLLTSFPAAHLMVRGNSVWTTVVGAPETVELRVDTGGDLQLAGSVELGSGGRTTASERSGLVRGANGALFFRTARYDGQTLTMEEVAEPYPDSSGFRGVVTREAGAWWEGPCRIRQGCGSMPAVCQPVRTCPQGVNDTDGSAFVIDEEAAWGARSAMMFQRPFDLATQAEQHQTLSSSFELPAAPFVTQGGSIAGLAIEGGVLLPVRDGLRFHYELLRVQGRVLSQTKEFIVTLPDPTDPFRLLFNQPMRR